MSIPFDIAALSAQVWNSLSDDSDAGEENEKRAETRGEASGFDFGSSLDLQLADSWASQLHSTLQQLDGGPIDFSALDAAISSLNQPASLDCEESTAASGAQDLLFPSTTVADINPLDEEQNQPISSLASFIEPFSLDQLIASALLESSNPKPASDDTVDEVDQMLDRLFNSESHGSSFTTPIITSSPMAPTTATSSEITIDPLLGSVAPSPPPTLSTPHSPQPILRTDASTSQQTLPPENRLQPLPNLSHRPATSLTTSLEQLANPPPGQQPNYPWWTIIRAAIMGSRYGMMTREEICEALANRWEYFRLTDTHETRIWKSAVGHNLSVKECFVRVFVEGEGNTSYYIIDTAIDPVKGRLSKGKNQDRVTVPRIARRPVIPSNLDLSTQARWSPAIAAIRNAKYGFPEVRPAPVPIARVAESDSDDEDGESDESDSAESSETDSAPQPMPGSLLGSSLSAIVGTNRPLSTKQSARPNSNARFKVPTQPLARPRQNRPPARSAPRQAQQRPSGSTSNSSLRPAPPARRRPAPRSTAVVRRLNHISPPRTIPVPSMEPDHRPLSPAFCPSSPVLRPPSPVALPVLLPRSPSPVLLSLEEQVAAALADVTASLPLQLDDECPSSPSRPSSPFALPMLPQSSLPVSMSLEEQVAAALADVTASLPLQLEEEDEEVPMAENQVALLAEDQVAPKTKDKEAPITEDRAEPQDDLPPSEPACPLFDFDNLMKEVQAEVEIELNEDDESLAESDGEGIALNLDNMLAAANAEILKAEPDASVPHELEESCIIPVDLNLEMAAESESDATPEPKKRSADEAGLDNLLQNLIDEATHIEEANMNMGSPFAIPDFNDEPGVDLAVQHLDDAIAQATAAAEARAQEELVKELEDRERARLKALSERITSSLIGVVQLTPSGDIPVHPLPLPPAPPASPVRFSPPSPPPVRVSHTRHRPPLTRRPTSSQPRPTVRTTAAARPKPTGPLVTIDRRTRASGARNPGRRLNLPLPSAHTPVDDRIDETALAPSLLESIQVVTLERPRNTFPELAKEAILSHPGGKMTAAEIFKVVEKKYPYFVTAPESWKATLRNVLTSHSCFVKIPRPADAPGRGDWWSTVDLPLWKRRRTTAKAKQDEDFLGRHAREQMRKSRVSVRQGLSAITGSSSVGVGRSSTASISLNLPRPFNMGMT